MQYKWQCINCHKAFFKIYLETTIISASVLNASLLSIHVNRHIKKKFLLKSLTKFKFGIPSFRSLKTCCLSNFFLMENTSLLHRYPTQTFPQVNIITIHPIHVPLFLNIDYFSLLRPRISFRLMFTPSYCEFKF